MTSANGDPVGEDMMAAGVPASFPGFSNQCNKVRKEGRKQTGLAREDSGEFYLQINLNRCALCAS